MLAKSQETVDLRQQTYGFFSGRLVAGLLGIVHDVLLGGLALALGVLDALHLLIFALGRHCDVVGCVEFGMRVVCDWYGWVTVRLDWV
jgi:hypothetical protein